MNAPQHKCSREELCNWKALHHQRLLLHRGRHYPAARNGCTCIQQVILWMTKHVQTKIFVRYSGSPGRSVGELPECSQDMMIDFTKSYYQHFTPVKEWS